MRAKELRELPTPELEKKLAALKEELFNLRFQKATGQQPNLSRMKLVRKDVARILTIMRERTLNQA